MSSPLDAAYYERLQGELRGILIELHEDFSPQESELFGSLIDANELGVALEMMIESLESSGAVLARRTADGLNRAAATMKMEARFQTPETAPTETDHSQVNDDLSGVRVPEPLLGSVGRRLSL